MGTNSEDEDYEYSSPIKTKPKRTKPRHKSKSDGRGTDRRDSHRADVPTNTKNQERNIPEEGQDQGHLPTNHATLILKTLNPM